MSSAPDRRHARAWAIFGLGLLLSLLIYHGFSVWGRRTDCQPGQADGQCGLASALGVLYGLAAGGPVFMAGVVVALIVGKAPAQRFRLRRTARVILFSNLGEVLLIRFQAHRDAEPFVFWVTPGGEIETSEEPRAAVERELFEELGIEVPLQGPVHEETGGTYTHLGETVHNYDYFFTAVCERDAPRLIGVTSEEIILMQEMRWWSVEELRATQERVFPEQLAELAVREWERRNPRK